RQVTVSRKCNELCDCRYIIVGQSQNIRWNSLKYSQNELKVRCVLMGSRK
ncbi:hypothetical protein Bhyg_07179, partial [Pseudolycoriella hygida]